MNPWLITLGPLIPPTEARRDLYKLAINKSSAEYVDSIWQLRIAAAPIARKSHKRNWPVKRAVSNVVSLKKARKT